MQECHSTGNDNSGGSRRNGIDGVSHQLGELVGIVRSLDDKFDVERQDAREHRELLHAEIRNVKHEQRGMQMKVDHACDSALKMEPIPPMVEKLRVRMDIVEKWQNRAAGAWSAATVFGVIVGFILANLLIPIMGWFKRLP